MTCVSPDIQSVSQSVSQSMSVCFNAASKEACELLCSVADDTPRTASPVLETRLVSSNLHFSTHPNNCYIYIYIYILRFPTRPALGRSYGRVSLYRHSYCRNKRKRTLIKVARFCGSSSRL